MTTEQPDSRESERDSTTGRRILVTGGAQGLGAALVRRLVAAGDRVAVADLDVAAGQELAAATGCLFVPADVAEFAADQAAVAATVERFGGLDALCVVAGVPGGTSVGADFDPEKYRHGLGVNLDGAVYAANAAIPHLRAAGGGAILITSSLAGVSPAVDLYYATAKHALIGLTRSLALVLWPDQIKVNAICPGFIDTQLVAKARNALLDHGIAIADPDYIAEAAQKVLASTETAQAWEVQAGRPAVKVAFHQVTLSRTDELRNARTESPG